MLITSSALLTILFSFQSAAGAEKNCLDPKVISAVKEKVAIPYDDLSSFDPCDENTDAYKLLHSLVLLKNLKLADGDLRRPLNQDILQNDFWAYFVNRASTIINESEFDSTCLRGAMAYVYSSQNDGNVHLCPVFYVNWINAYDRAYTMLHEARHFAGYTHVTCNRGPNTGKEGFCDTSIDEKGSYAVTVESLTKMAVLVDGLTPAAKFLLKTTAINWTDTSFNEVVLPQGFRATYLVGDDHKGYIYNGANLSEVPSFEKAKVISRDASLLVFPEDKSDSFTVDFYSKNFDHLPVLGVAAIDYNNMKVAERPTFVDVINANYLTSLAYDSLLEAKMAEEKEFTKVRLEFSPKAIFLGSELTQNNRDSVYVLSNKDEMYKVSFQAGLGGVEKVENVSAGYRALIMFNDQRLGLTDSGEVKVEKNGIWSSLPLLEDKRFTSMTRSFNWTEYFANPESSN